MFDIVWLLTIAVMVTAAITSISATRWRQMTLDHQLKRMQEQEKVDQAIHERWMAEERLKAELNVSDEVRLAALATGRAQAEAATAATAFRQSEADHERLERSMRYGYRT